MDTFKVWHKSDKSRLRAGAFIEMVKAESEREALQDVASRTHTISSPHYKGKQTFSVEELVAHKQIVDNTYETMEITEGIEASLRERYPAAEISVRDDRRRAEIVFSEGKHRTVVISISRTYGETKGGQRGYVGAGYNVSARSTTNSLAADADELPRCIERERDGRSEPLNRDYPRSMQWG